MPQNSDIPENTTIFYDFETTGLNPFHDKVIEYTFIKYWGHIKKSTSSSLINPQEPLDAKITEITSITDEMLADQPTINDKSRDIFNFVTEEQRIEYSNHPEDSSLGIFNTYMIAHNSHNFDRFFFNRIINKETSNQGIYHIYHIDTCHLAKLLLPKMRSVSLKSLCKLFHITNGNHRSTGDTEALIKVYEKMIHMLSRRIGRDSKELFDNPQIVFDILYT